MTITANDLPKILADHVKWLEKDPEGRRADLSGANLREADLRRADLSEADLRDAVLLQADLSGAKIRDGIEIKLPPLQVSGLHYPVIIFDDHMQIGCKFHSLSEWMEFDNDSIIRMDGKAAATFWLANKDALLALAAANGRRLGKR